MSRPDAVPAASSCGDTISAPRAGTCFSGLISAFHIWRTLKTLLGFVVVWIWGCAFCLVSFSSVFRLCFAALDRCKSLKWFFFFFASYVCVFFFPTMCLSLACVREFLKMRGCACWSRCKYICFHMEAQGWVENLSLFLPILFTEAWLFDWIHSLTLQLD